MSEVLYGLDLGEIRQCQLNFVNHREASEILRDVLYVTSIRIQAILRDTALNDKGRSQL